MKKLVHLSITGRVQGVGYRAFVETQAAALDLEGWVRNRRDGSVEAVAVGDALQVEELIEACRKGPPASLVDAIEVADAWEELLAIRPAGRKFAFLPTL